MITITAHLLNYTIHHVCRGNKSECARKLGMPRTDFNKSYNRCMSGGSSYTMLESILQVYAREGYSLDEALAAYGAEGSMGKGERRKNEACDSVTRVIRMQLSDDGRAAEQKAHVLQAAEKFMEQLEYTFCRGICAEENACMGDCPCKRFSDYTKWMKEKLESAMSCSQPQEDTSFPISR